MGDEMSFEMYGAFFAATLVMLATPGPTVLMVVSHSVSHGPRAVVPLALGVMLGDLTAMTVSLLGLGALLATSAFVFTLMKWAGAVYLVYLGIRLWRTDNSLFSRENMARPVFAGRALFVDAYVVTALNPKGIAFFVAFLPQFVNPHAPVLPQFLILGSTFLLLCTINATVYAIFAGRIREKIRKPETRRVVNRFGGTVLIGAGVLMSTMKRSL